MNLVTTARAAVLVAGCTAFAVVSAAPASADVIDEHLVSICSEPRDQICGAPLGTRVHSEGEQALVRFTADRGHCSSIISIVYVNGVERGRSTLGPGQTSSTVVSLPQGDSTVGIDGVGFVNGCNTGVLGSWEGDLRIIGPI